MSDIFISYSSKDHEQATQLTELLASAGLSVWIDQSGIDLSTSWSREIVQAINQCQAFVVLLSPNSIVSNNVIKEVSLASEKRKKILPLDLEPVELTEDFEYQLAGIQRAPMTNIDAVIRALAKLGLEATGAPQPPKLVKETDGRKSLMILPFEDLSPTGDNAWFADGIVSELISALSNVKALRVTDAATTKEYKSYKGHLATYASEMQIHYFVQGDVRKFGDQIKISSRLLDIETGDHLWQDSMKGTINDIFDIQEKVAEKVLEGLKVHLATDENAKLTKRSSENAEAYEFFLKAGEYFSRQTKEGLDLAFQLYSEAIKLDPGYAIAYASKANVLVSLYKAYKPDPSLLEEGLQLIAEAFRLKPDLWSANYPLSNILRFQGKLEAAEEAGKDYMRNAPEHSQAYFWLGNFYMETGQNDKAIALLEEAQRIEPESLIILRNLVTVCNGAKNVEKRRHWSEVAIPLYEKHLKLFPDVEDMRVSHASLLHWAGRVDEARDAARRMDNLRDGRALFNAACLRCRLEDYESGLKIFRKAIKAGFRGIHYLKQFLNDDGSGIGKLKGTSEYEEVARMVEELSEP